MVKLGGNICSYCNTEFVYCAQFKKFPFNRLMVEAIEEAAASVEDPLGQAAPAELAAALMVEAAARTEDGYFVCLHCGCSCTTKHRMELHLIRKHIAMEPVICSCGQPFHVLEDRDAHVKRPIYQKRMVKLWGNICSYCTTEYVYCAQF
jgi:hypothetical protein